MDVASRLAGCAMSGAEPKLKRARVDTSERDTSNGSDTLQKFLSFSQFSVDRILFTKPENKSIALLGKFTGSEESGILVVEKQPITEESISGLFSRDAKVTCSFHNDIYSQYIVDGECGLGEVRVMGVYPASEDHITKYSDQKLHLVHESPHHYQSITKPFIESQAFALEVRLSTCIHIDPL